MKKLIHQNCIQLMKHFLCLWNLKEILYRGTVMGPIEAQRYASNLERNLQGMEDSVEGPKAFSEKRAPVFKNQ